MPAFKQVYEELRKPIHRCAILLLIALMGIVAASLFHSRADVMRQESEQFLRSTLHEYRQTMEAERILLTEKDRYDHLRSQGFVGKEPRLEWIEDVRNIAQRADLVSIKYQLESRQAVHSGPRSENLQLFASTMKLDLQLRHEGDLVSFLDILEGRRGGLFQLRACELVSISDSPRFHPSDANLRAQCILRWFSLDEPQISTGEEFL